ncbi:ABC transporter permease [Devosia rhodophyticola]|uniref:ABC transporter permease n=1 Tax=Devosia rhodophyticola TaxID=3026423 RepID=A0ABY7YTL8_9HYPH|nr:ABC transporter permease [Devosia rhodophyticola]WDR04649.1 ABC transporter permease [Devosia rhodophyticola]
MLRYTLRRVLEFIPTIFIAVTLIFVITRLVPGSPITALIGNQSVDAAKIDAMAQQLGLDRPVWEQYIEWLPRVVTGNFGQSMFFSAPVVDVILDRFPVTFSLTFLALIVTIAIGIPIGILSAMRRGGIFDYFGNVLSSLGMALPPFWLGFMLMLVFAVGLQWVPASGYRPIEFGFWNWFSRLLLPVAALSVSQIGLVVRMTRSTMIEVLGTEYVGMARTKGLRERTVILKHALRNAMIQIVTVIGLVFALGLGGSVIIENVFALPGLGELITTAAVRRDYPTLEGGIFYLTLVALAINLVVDLAYAYFNPRIRYS